MDRETTVTTTQDFLLLDCQSEQYSINFSEHLLSPDVKYTVHYTYPDDSTKSIIAEFVRENQLFVKNPPEFDHPCTVNVEVFANGSEQCLTKFSLDLVSPVEYLFRKYSQDHNEMCSSDKMTSALLAMSMSYYYVMEEQMKVERKADKILATLFTGHRNTTPPKHITSVQSATHDDSIKEFAKRHQLQCTLQCLPSSDPQNMYETPCKHPVFNGESKTVAESSVTSVPQEGCYTPLTNTDDGCHQSEYAPLTDSVEEATTAGVYEIPIANNQNSNSSKHKLNFLATRQPVAVHVQPPQPYSKKKLERTKSLDNIADMDHEYMYISPDVTRSKSPASRPRPPRPPPPRVPTSPNRPPIKQRTPPSSSPAHKLRFVRPTNSVPLPPTPKQRTTDQRYKKKH